MHLNILYLRIIIIIINLKKIKGQAPANTSIYRTDEPYNGTSSPCTPAKTYTESQLDMITDVTDHNNLVWIGTYLNYTQWMEYKGCYQLKRRNLYNKTYSRTPLSLFECYSTCTNNIYFQYIGIQQNVCYCLKRLDFRVSERCNATICGENPRILCGERNNYVAVYNLINLKPTEIDIESHGHCGTLYNGVGTTTLKVFSCDKQAYPVCFENKTNVVYNQVETWVNSMRKCENMQLIPSTSTSIRSNKALTANGYFWISTIRGSKIYSYKDNKDTLKSHCLAALIDDQLTINHLIPLNCSTNLRVLCEMTTANTDSTTTGNLEGLGSTEYTDRNLPTNNSNLSNIHRSTRNGIPWTDIGGTTGGSVVLIIIVIVVLYKTRRHDKNKQGKPDSTVEPYHTTGMSNTVTTGQHDNSGQGEYNVYDHTDHNPSGPKRGQSDVQESEYHTMAYVRNDTEGLYDTSRGPVVTVKQDFTEQIYDHSGTSGGNDFVESTYDYV